MIDNLRGEYSHTIGDPHTGEHPGEMFPEIIIEKSGVKITGEFVIPEPYGGLSIVIIETTNTIFFLGPHVDHLFGGFGEGITEN